ncbi:hypothetical protein EJV47_05660 [Hymenobacter gummosus]|uniref:TonB-dependent receptor plug domain-containing protein n=1 Tax=Hymenobacter gummosus TaxID=1776032 RepID=A0A3S0JCX8_9BACT|nr:hypothetical protein [Hymenobacter gummosus]RTQ52497.1 hypothetical protein EJV47_05660 [Hymenobacter gummosus]
MKLLLLSALLLPGAACLAQLPPGAPPDDNEVVEGQARAYRAVPAALTFYTPLRWRGPLRVVNGQPLPDSVDTPPAEDIIGLRELEPAEAVKRFGPAAKNGALLIETERRRRRQ